MGSIGCLGVKIFCFAIYACGLRARVVDVRLFSIGEIARPHVVEPWVCVELRDGGRSSCMD